MISSWLEQEWLLRRLSGLEGDDEELGRAIERLRKNFYEAWKVLKEYRKNPEVLEEWQRAQKPSLAWRKGFFLREALKVLSVMTDALSTKEAGAPTRTPAWYAAATSAA